jgi:hypothetical protein
VVEMNRLFITKELLEKYKENKPKNYEEMFEMSNIKAKDIDIETAQINYIESLLNLKSVFRKMERSFVDDDYRKGIKLSLPEIYKESTTLTLRVEEVVWNYFILLKTILNKINKKEQEKSELIKVSLQISKDFFKILSKNNNESFIFKNNKKNFEENLIINSIFLASKSIEDFDKKPFPEIIEYFKTNLENIGKLINIIGVKEEEILEKSLIEYVMSIEKNEEERKSSRKLLKFSELNTELKEMLKEYLKKTFFNIQKIDERYPDFENWLEKVYKEIDEDNSKREILLLTNFTSTILQMEIEGIVILKNTEEEKKICYLFLTYPYSYREEMYDGIFEYLGTKTPIISMEKLIFKEKYLGFLKPYFPENEKLNFKLTSIVPNKYVKGKTELIFNEVGKDEIDLEEIDKI